MYYEGKGNSSLGSSNLGAKLKLGLSVGELSKIAKDKLQTKAVSSILAETEKKSIFRNLSEISNASLTIDGIGQYITPPYEIIKILAVDGYDQNAYIMTVALSVARINSFYSPMIVSEEPLLWEHTLIGDFDKFMNPADGFMKPLMQKILTELNSYIAAKKSGSAGESQIIRLINASNTLHTQYLSYYPKLYPNQK